jgi:tRNA-2-methylthio-N6-dimethylallyladenosine synthase
MEKNYTKYFLPNIKQGRNRLNESSIRRDVFNTSNKLRTIGKDRTFFIKTYGCQSNSRDTEDISGILMFLGFSASTTLEKSDLVILNTCAVRENAEEKVFGKIGFLKNSKKSNKKFLFGICGCMAQEESTVNKIINNIKHVDFIFGTHNIHMLPEILDQVINHKQKVIHVLSKEGDIIEGLPTERTSKIKAYVNIMYGCDKFCSYCIVPYTRGKIRSRSKKDILDEVKSLKELGYQEVTLLGQNVNSYGVDTKNNY